MRGDRIVFVPFTRQDGSEIYVSIPPGIIVAPRSANDAEWVKARIMLGGIVQDVEQTVDEVIERFEDH